MFAIIEEFNQTLASEEIKLALIRFISEFLIQTAHFSVNYLDDLIDLKYADEKRVIFDTGEFNTYGSQLFVEFAKVFKALYVGERPRHEEAETENFQKDICLCLNVLFSSCQSAKCLAVEQNFLKKVVDVCGENASAIYLQQLAKYQGSASSAQDKVSQQREKAFRQQ